MTQHPLSSVLKELDYQPIAGFRETLRAQLLADLASTDAQSFDSHPSTDDNDNDLPQEVTVLKKVDRSQWHRTRILLGIAASLIIAAGAIAVIINRSHSADDSPFTGDDSSIARAALISVDQLGPGWAVDPHVTTTWANWRDVSATQPECAEFSVVLQPVGSTATGAIAPLYNLQNQVAFELLSIYPNKKAASHAMDSMESPAFQACWFATFDAISRIDFPGTGPTTKGFDLAPPTLHGDRQIDFGMEMHTAIDSRTRLFHSVWIQVDRSIISLTVSPDGLPSDDPSGLLETSVSQALAALGEAMPAG